VQDLQIGRGLRALRHKRGWRQRDLSLAANVARSVIVDLEAGRIGQHTVSALRSVAAALGATIQIALDWRGAEIWRLLEAHHAALQEVWARRLREVGWLVQPESTFNRYGERGSIDLLAWHPATGVLLVIEIKTAILDLQALFARVDVKTRQASSLARQLGWRPTVRIPMLVVAEGTTSRRRIDEHGALFARFALRGAAALQWLRAPGVGPNGLLCLSKLPTARSGDRRRAGRQRIRLSRADPRSAASPGMPAESSALA
jgi:transcriptional regulator with XRE-family HTH domain